MFKGCFYISLHKLAFHAFVTFLQDILNVLPLFFKCIFVSRIVGFYVLYKLHLFPSDLSFVLWFNMLFFVMLAFIFSFFHFHVV